jgi:hypothetical protein
VQTHDPVHVADTAGASSDLVIGQKLAYAAASLAMGLCAFVSLLGMEKAILAIIFGVLALRNGTARLPARLGLARFGVVLGILQIVLVLAMLLVFHDQVLRFFEHLERFQLRR